MIQPKTITTQNKTVEILKNRSNLNDLKNRSKTHPDRIEKIWNNEVVYLIGGGPSLKGFDWSKLKGKKIIAINRAFQVLPDADVLYWTDSRFYTWYKQEIDNFKGLKVTCHSVVDNPGDVTVLKPVSSLILDKRLDTITSGNNSGFGAISLAIKLGGKRIYLLGYDMHSSEKETHWHDGYKVSHNHAIYPKMIVQFSSIADQIKNLGVEIYNANPKSKLNSFIKVDLESAINDSIK